MSGFFQDGTSSLWDVLRNCWVSYFYGPRCRWWSTIAFSTHWPCTVSLVMSGHCLCRSSCCHRLSLRWWQRSCGQCLYRSSCCHRLSLRCWQRSCGHCLYRSSCCHRSSLRWWQRSCGHCLYRSSWHHWLSLRWWQQSCRRGLYENGLLSLRWWLHSFGGARTGVFLWIRALCFCTRTGVLFFSIWIWTLWDREIQWGLEYRSKSAYYDKDRPVVKLASYLTMFPYEY